eukprot:6271429-Amphidinium_carterae.1
MGKQMGWYGGSSLLQTLKLCDSGISRDLKIQSLRIAYRSNCSCSLYIGFGSEKVVDLKQTHVKPADSTPGGQATGAVASAAAPAPAASTHEQPASHTGPSVQHSCRIGQQIKSVLLRAADETREGLCQFS